MERGRQSRDGPHSSRAADALARLAAQFWEGWLRANPVTATSIGDRRFDDRLEDNSPAGLAAERSRLAAVLERARGIAPDGLPTADRLTRTALLSEVGNEIDSIDCHLEDWTVDPLGGPQVNLLNIESFQAVETPAQGDAMVARWRAMGPYVDQHVENLRRGLSAGRLAVRSQVEKVISELDDLAHEPDTAWALLNPLKVDRPRWPEAERVRFRDGLERAVHDVVRPAFARYRAFLDAEIRPRARPNDRPGILHVDGGAQCYGKLVRVHTSLDKSADDIHALGLSEIARIDGEMTALGEKVLGARGHAAVLERLRHDRALYFSTPDEVFHKAESALARAKAAIPRWFGILPRAPCEVRRMEEHEVKNSTIAYYREPAADGSRPGRYYINTYAPETRPRYEAETLAWHEAIPGHHLQIAIAQERTDLPSFRRHLGTTAYVEGWGLYAERLAEEMGLYSADLDRIGMLSFDAWRAGRLVVDTGMHSKGWTRDQAIAFLREHTALAENNIENEVDRYITWPAQALAYKLGQVEILALRDEARRRLGPRFDPRAFHDVVLSNGALPLGALREAVEAWIAAPRP